jgi:AraC family transcriptional regulator of adaptative response/methylated-DNA-[protein]-cysteine methyltransferase
MYSAMKKTVDSRASSPALAVKQHDLRQRLGSGARLRASSAHWKAVVARDARFDDKLFYAVLTTGVYCRPSCGARLPKRENVRFFATRAEAERAGYRACKRCKPELPPLAQRNATQIEEACRMIEQSATPPNLAQLARAAQLSPYHFHRTFKAVTGLTPKAYADGCRAQRVQAALSQGDNVTRAAFAAGFNSTGRFYEQSQARLGMTPSRFREGAPELRIQFALGRCTLGALLVASSERGVCAILLGDDAAALRADLACRFPKAELVSAELGFQKLVTEVVGLIEEPARGFSLPLDLRGTVFQERVFRALRDIPPGETVSYSELSRRLGMPKAVRAVARACAANPLAVAIPCHRVVREDGSLAGYRWGLARKQALLARERGALVQPPSGRPPSSGV